MIRLFSALHLGFPLIYVLSTAVVFDIPPSKVAAFVLTPLFLLVTAAALVAGFALREMRRWAWHATLVSCGLIIYCNTILILNYSASHQQAIAFLVSNAVALGIAYQVTRELRVPYLLPRIRWWETNPAFRLDAPVMLTSKDQGGGVRAWEGRIMDFSGRGCFIKMRDLPPEDVSVEVRFTLLGKDYRVSGTVVWTTETGVTHPRGAGVKFDRADRQLRRDLRQLSGKLRELANLGGESQNL
ncbi:MAG TPA: PilZ domain-containing protein [Bdellovibrionota bacterium]|nr:PilZ domain-containing protein [Bdellovibrionota bacterium]